MVKLLSLTFVILLPASTLLALEWGPNVGPTESGNYYRIQVGDFTHDNTIDIAVGSWPRVDVWTNDGSANWIAETPPTTTGDQGTEIVVGDFNNDSHLDICGTGNFSSGLWMGNGVSPLVWTPGTGVPNIGNDNQNMAVGEFNGDNNLDVVLSNWWNLAVMLGNGAGGWSGQIDIGPYYTGSHYIDTADFNRDGNLDFAVCRSDPNPPWPMIRFDIYLGNGAGGFNLAATIQGPYHGLATGDFNNDGNPDIAASFSGRSVDIFLGDGTGLGWICSDTLYHSSAFCPTAGDLNGDGNQDIVCTDSIWLGNGNGTFSPPEPSPSFLPSGELQYKIADFNNDGFLDLAAVGGWLSEGVRVWLQQVDVSITLTPDQTTVRRGGTLGITITVTNNTGETQTFEAWTEVTLPNGHPWPGNPVIGPRTVTLTPYQTRSRHISHRVPNNAPLGTYKYCGKVGTYPTPVMNEDCFNFTVTP